MTDDDTRARLKHSLANLESLPAMPSIAQKLLALPLDTEEGEMELLSLIEQDPQISAKLIGLANSPIMGVMRKVSTVHDAAMLLGLTRVKSVSIGIATMSDFSRLPASRNFKPQDLWLHCMITAVVMRTIAAAMPARIRPPEDQIYLAGLLHDIGFMALHHLDHELSNELHRQLHLQPERPVLEIELETLGITHCYIGSQIARHWNLPKEIGEVLGYHHPPYVDEMPEQNLLARLVSVAEKLQPDFGISEHTGDEVHAHEWAELGIELSAVEEIGIQANELAIQATQIAI
ncbi:MAG TPA: HDOD domain-containing protein [Gallionella sp.]|nr:HDOD domain-containing protein [Gallionella sp.]